MSFELPIDEPAPTWLPYPHLRSCLGRANFAAKLTYEHVSDATAEARLAEPRDDPELSVCGHPLGEFLEPVLDQDNKAISEFPN